MGDHDDKPSFSEVRSEVQSQAADMPPAAKADFSGVQSHVSSTVDETGAYTVAAGDSLAFGVVSALTELGVRIPEQMSIVSIDDLPHAQFLSPPLTAIHIPMRELGAVGLDLLREELQGLPIPRKRIELACRLHVRGSTGKRPR